MWCGNKYFILGLLRCAYFFIYFMFKKLIVSFTILTTFALVGCKQEPRNVSWEEALSLLNSGNVKMVGQAHSLEVTFTLKDGSIVHTMEPKIDVIFDEVKKCGETCKGIPLATE